MHTRRVHTYVYMRLRTVYCTALYLLLNSVSRASTMEVQEREESFWTHPTERQSWS